MLQPVPSLYVPPCAIADKCELASCSYDAKRPHRGRRFRVALSSINGVGAHTARAPLFNQCVGVRGRTRHARPIIPK